MSFHGSFFAGTLRYRIGNDFFLVSRSWKTIYIIGSFVTVRSFSFRRIASGVQPARFECYFDKNKSTKAKKRKKERSTKDVPHTSAPSGMLSCVGDGVVGVVDRSRSEKSRAGTQFPGGCDPPSRNHPVYA